ncbi:UbiA prenyltransferase family-domain-containing protein [Protomyces lactucae-debilis]|uniref:Protoheme IX farnesyltransferase, mitochondrial n=1 Tax=Protomyces lactucae-debilis TaxID=2754530 RepID=A0A1Y2ETE8_PROLT|nr:UbiA prenyltransferase family-domain-containing protein [Protomyces lactucae-debilis]ORY74584.1 UbiA prenyltransferase family-domain-containing protein [Protomyces lactucae-debilis]
MLRRGLATAQLAGKAAEARLLQKPGYNAYLALAKPRLTTLVVLSTMSSYALCPFESNLPTLVCLTVGTTLCSASANTYNMWLEPPFDSQMARTRNRPLVKGSLHPDDAFRMGSLTGLAGVGLLAWGVNPTCALLGLANIGLYAGVYTPLKRQHIINTWVGAVVGAIPPAMGWFALSPYPFLSQENMGCLYLAALLYAWQFPHFNSLSWYIREEYARAGYVMTSILHPGMNARVSLRYSLLTFPICFGLVYANVCDAYFMLDSSLLNLYLSYRAYDFWRQRGSERERTGSAKKLFFASLVYLPGVLLLALAHKRGLWDFLEDVVDD